MALLATACSTVIVATPTPIPTTTIGSIAPSASLNVPSEASHESTLGSDAADALDLATRFETARAAGRWPEAWGLLSDRSKGAIGTLAAFQSEETAYNASGGADFVIQAPTQDPELLANFLGASQHEIAQQADLTRGYLVFVMHPQVKAASAGTTGLFVAPLASGDWKIWILH